MWDYAESLTSPPERIHHIYGHTNSPLFARWPRDNVPINKDVFKKWVCLVIAVVKKNFYKDIFGIILSNIISLLRELKSHSCINAIRSIKNLLNPILSNKTSELKRHYFRITGEVYRPRNLNNEEEKIEEYKSEITKVYKKWNDVLKEKGFREYELFGFQK